MILILLFVIIILLGLILMKSNASYDVNAAGAIISRLGTVFLITSLIIIIAAHATANNSIQKIKIEYEGLCKRYEIAKSEFEDVSKSDVIADITAWNMEVYDIKYWSENPWTNFSFINRSFCETINFDKNEQIYSYRGHHLRGVLRSEHPL